MVSPSSPGVYIDEITTLPASIAAVETAIPAFVGYTKTLDKNGVTDALKNVPVRITSLLDYEEIFGKYHDEAIQLTIRDFYNDDNVLTDRIYGATLAAPSDYKLYYSLQLFYANGGGPCYIVAVGDYTDPVDAAELTTGLNALEKVDEPTLLVFPDKIAVADCAAVYDAALAQCQKLKDRFVIMDVKEETDVAADDAANFRDSGVGIDNLKYGAVYYPNLKTSLAYGFNEALTVSHTNNGGNAAPAPAFNALALSAINTANPSVYRSVLAEIGRLFVEIPPSGAVAGIYARVDRERGVWKAPANVGIRNVVGPTKKISQEEQDGFNIDATSGKSINVIRPFTGKGTLVWGARTLAGNDNEWKYVPVRRLFTFVEESVLKATEFIVFEPNDANTWLRTKTMIENFLIQLWRDGALAGAKPDEAFFVKIGLGITMSAVDILEGRMNVDIGMAAVRPAEFIILKFSHKMQTS